MQQKSNNKKISAHWLGYWETVYKQIYTESQFSSPKRTIFQSLPHGDAIKCLLLLISFGSCPSTAKVNIIIIIIPTATSIFFLGIL